MTVEQSDAPSCANCGRVIGRLEVPRHWGGHVVCAPCDAILSSAPHAAAAPPPYAPPYAAAPAVPSPAHPPAAYPPAGRPPVAYVPGLYDASRYPLTAPTPAPAYAPPADGASGPLSCGTCGGAFGINELTEENGHVVCRACALGAAAAGASVRRRRRRARDGSPAVLVGVGAVLVVAVTGGVLLLRSSGPEPKTVTAAPGTPSAADPGPATPVTAAPARPAVAAGRGGVDPGSATRPATGLPARTESPDGGGSDVGGRLFGDGVTASRGGDDPAPSAPGPRSPAAESPPSAAVEPRPTSPSLTPTPTPTPPAASPPVLFPPAASPPATYPRTPAPAVATARPTPATPNPSRPAAATPATAPAVAAAAAPTTPLGRGTAALAEGNAQAALVAFQEAVRESPRSPDGFHGLGLAYHRLNQSPAARQNMERALTASLGKPDRALIWNFAVVHVKGEPMRAARVVREYLAGPAGAAHDEDLLNVLGAAVFRAPDSARSTTYWAETRSFYMERDAALVAAKGAGRKRWGSEWVDSGSATRMWQALARNEASFEQARRAFNAAFVARQRAWDRVSDLQSQLRLSGSQELPNARAAYAQADQAAQAAGRRSAEAQEALRETQQPTFPETWETLPISASDSPGRR